MDGPPPTDGLPPVDILFPERDLPLFVGRAARYLEIALFSFNTIVLKHTDYCEQLNLS